MFFREHDLKDRDVIWVSKDCVDIASPVILGEYYCLIDDKFELYEDQLVEDMLFILTNTTFKENEDREWYQFWKPKQIIHGYEFTCISLEEEDESRS